MKAAKKIWHAAMKAKYEFEWNVLSQSNYKKWGLNVRSSGPYLNTCIKVEAAFDEWLALNP